ncbi:MAG: LysM peptidoglycan-binding domain-containing protein [Deltaproteobacteria bacterium]|nr:LysM peptidoglycan-binding domain-containing protein [Deltaproteobacteria bacterium]
MARFIRWSWVLWVLALLPVDWATAYGQSTPSVVDQQIQEEFLEYRLRPGESLSDIARLFRLPVEELAQVNHIADPTRLQVGQLLKVPNFFARQAAQLQGERNQLLVEKEQMGKELETRQKTLTAVEAELQGVEAEKSVLTRELAATLQWQRATLSLAVLLLGVFGWGLKLRADRATLVRKLAVLMQENTTLSVAKEKYRQAVAQLEFRYQKLSRAPDGVPAKFVLDGTALLTRAFAEGSAQMEHMLASIKAEREKEEQLLQAEPKTFDFLFHPLRGFLQRHRLKVHEA